MMKTGKTGQLGAIVLILLGAAACSSSPASDKKVGSTGTSNTGAPNSNTVIFSTGGTSSTAHGSGTGNSGNKSSSSSSTSSASSSGDSTDSSGPIPEGQDLVAVTGDVKDLVQKACTGKQIEAEPQPVVLQLVLDVSGSMLDAPPGDTRSKWAISSDAIVKAMDQLAPNAAVGLSFFPNVQTRTWTQKQPDIPCVNTKDDLAIAALNGLGSTQRQNIQATFAKVKPVFNTGTPTLDAYNIGLNYLQTTNWQGSKFLLLMTDGQPTYDAQCLGDGTAESYTPTQPIVDAIKNAAANGIKTFIIGSPGSEQSSRTGVDARAWLSDAAVAGQTSYLRLGCNNQGGNQGNLYCHFDMTTGSDFEGSLAAALQTIASAIVSCDYTVEKPDELQGQVLDPKKVAVIYTKNGQGGDQFYVQKDNGSGDCQRGWQLTADDQIEICGSTCDTIRSDPAASLNILFGCSPISLVQ